MASAASEASIDLTWDDTQQALADAVEAFCRERCTPDVVRAAANEGPGTLFTELAALGVLATGAPVGEGGPLELASAMEGLGHAVFPGPVVETALALQVLPEAEAHEIASGRRLVSLGRPPVLPFASHTDLHLELAPDGVYRLRAEGELEPVATLGGEPAARGRFERVALLSNDTHALAHHDLARASYLAAAGRRVIAEAADHARTRRQFGRPIGAFQAVAHPLAEGHIALLAAQTLARSAAAALAESSAHAPALASAARLSACRAAVDATHAAHQAFGAIGVTVDGPLWFATRRIRQLASAVPTAGAARERVLDLFLHPGGV